MTRLSRSEGRAQGVRRDQGRRRRHVLGGARRDRRRDRPERLAARRRCSTAFWGRSSHGGWRRVLRRGHHRHVAARTVAAGRRAHVPDAAGLRQLTVRDNLIAAAQEFKGTLVGRLFAQARRRARPSRRRDDRALPPEARRAPARQATLSYGQQKLIDIAMAFMPAPRLVLLDEPCAGVNPSLVDQLRELLVELNKTQGGSFVVIEHNMDFIMRLCPHVICMVEGKVMAEGPPAAVQANRQARLGMALSSATRLPARRWSAARGQRHVRQDHRVRQGRRRLFAEPDDPERDDARRVQGRDHAADRTQRRGQVDGAEDAVRHADAALGRDPLRRPAHQRQAAARTARRGHRVRSAGPQPVRLAVGAPQPRARRHHAAARASCPGASRRC